MTSYLERPGGRIAFDDSGGTGPLVVAAPGMGDLRAAYRHLVPLLTAAGYRVVTMDLRGAGDSSVLWDDYSDAAIATDIVALVDHIGAGPATVIGNSLTASSAVIAAVEHADRVSRLVLIGPFVRDVPAPAWQKAAFKVMLSPPWGKSAWLSYYRSKMYPGRKPADHDEYVLRLGNNLNESGRYKAFRSLAFNSHAESERRLDSVTVPTLVIMGTADPDFADPAAEAEFIVSRLSGDSVLVNGAGHYPQAEEPESVAAAILQFAGSDHS